VRVCVCVRQWLKSAEPVTLDTSSLIALRHLAETHSTIFFRPLLACVAADKVNRIVKDLGQLIHLTSVLGGQYILLKSLDLTTVVLSSAPPRSNGATLGQHALVIEYILFLGRLRKSDEVGF
jgi:hypothetical protein